MEPNLITHLFIETYFKTKGLLTEEHFLYGKEREQLFESYGIFNGCEEGAEEIISELEKYQDGEKTEVYLTPPSLQFFTKTVKIMFNYDKNICSYSHKQSIFGNDGKYNCIVLKINPNVPRWTLLTNLMHELTHAYQDYNMHLKGYSGTEHAKHTGYAKTAYYLMNEKDDVLTVMMSRLMYQLNLLERGAHMTSLLSKTKEMLERHEFKNIKQAMDFIKNNSVVIQNYGTIKEYADMFTSADNEELQKEYLQIANKVSGYGFKNYNTFVKWVRSRVDSIFRKIEKNLYMIVDKYLVISEYMLPSDLADLILK